MFPPSAKYMRPAQGDQGALKRQLRQPGKNVPPGDERKRDKAEGVLVHRDEERIRRAASG